MTTSENTPSIPVHRSPNDHTPKPRPKRARVLRSSPPRSELASARAADLARIQRFRSQAASSARARHVRGEAQEAWDADFGRYADDAVRSFSPDVLESIGLPERDFGLFPPGARRQQEA